MDRLELMNLVLTKLGQDEQLDDPDTNSSRAAIALRSAWDSSRDTVLRAHLWNFAVDPAGAQLAADGSYVPSSLADHSHRFATPADFLRLDPQRMRPELDRHEYRATNRYIYTSNAGPLLISYVAKVEECGEWDALFVDAFKCHLAAETTQRITGGDPSHGDLMANYRYALAHAKAVDGRENPPEEIEDSDWVNARYQGGSTWA